MDPLDRHDLTPMRRILNRAHIKYLDVRPSGIELFGGPCPVHRAVATIYDYGSARTLYRQRKPACRSLDGATSITRKDWEGANEMPRLCVTCIQRPSCTPQVRLDLLIEAHSYRALLAFTSATNFLIYEADIHRQGVLLDRIDTEITVVDRGRWGEMRFRQLT